MSDFTCKYKNSTNGEIVDRIGIVFDASHRTSGRRMVLYKTRTCEHFVMNENEFLNTHYILQSDVNEMSSIRYSYLNKAGNGLTEDEKDLGWHFCPDWDQMLIGPGMSEMSCCNCGNGEENVV